LFYQILDGLRSLTGYDHSALLLVRVDGAESLELVAEQLAFRKGRSQRIGATIPIPPEAVSRMVQGSVWGYSLQGQASTPWHEHGPPGVPAFLQQALGPHKHLPGDPAPAEAEAIIAPMHVREQLAAILKISALQPGTFGHYETGLVHAFLPHASV